MAKISRIAIGVACLCWVVFVAHWYCSDPVFSEDVSWSVDWVGSHFMGFMAGVVSLGFFAGILALGYALVRLIAEDANGK